MSVASSFLWKITRLCFILGTISHSEQEDVTCQKYFRKTGRGGEVLNSNDVLFNHAVTSELFCGELCIRESSCTGFNYITGGNQSDTNCQITGGLHPNIDVINGATNWDFYQSLQTIQACPNGWLQLSSSCYYVSKTKTNYSNATSACHSMGADLFLPLTEEETQTISGSLTQRKYWIGLKLEPNTRKFCTTSGKHPTYTKWGGGEPNNIPWENCVQFITFREGRWNNIPCSLAFHYICQIRC